MKKRIKDNNKYSQSFVTILGIKISSTSEDELLSSIQEKLSKKTQFVIVTPNPEIILEAVNDPELVKSLNSADFSIPDGVGLKLAAPKLQIIKGRKFMLKLFSLANELNLKVYLLGSTNEVTKKSLKKISIDFPGINAKGNSGPALDKSANPVSEIDSNLQFEIVKEINAFKPDLLFVAFGAPKQEKWIAKHLKELKVIGVMAIGGSLDYFSGSVLPVPKLIE